MQKRPAFSLSTAVLASGLLLTACGGGSGGSGSGTGTTTVSGTAATGAALAGATVTLSCGGGLTRTATANAVGLWSASVPTTALPCAVSASGGGENYYSFTVGNGNSIVTNVTPLTTLALAQILGSIPASLSAIDLTRLTGTAIDAAIAALNTALVGYALPAGFNPVTTPLTAATGGQSGNDHDRLLDQFGAANPNFDELVADAADGTMPELATPSHTPGAASASEFFSTFAGDYALTVAFSGAEGSNNTAVTTLFPANSARVVHIKANGDVSIDAVGRVIRYTALAYDGTAGAPKAGKWTEFDGDTSENTVRYRSGNSPVDLYINYNATNGLLEVSLQGFTNNEGYASLKGAIFVPPTPPVVTPPADCGNGAALTFSAGTGAPYSDGQVVCFTTISKTTLAFEGKSLTNPTQNTAVMAPYSAWKFADGSYVYEVIFNDGVLHEINLSNGSAFLGQFAP